MPRLQVNECAVCHSENISFFKKVYDYSITGDSFTIVKCNDCSFKFIQDPPLESECGPYYQSEDYISHSDSKKGITFKLYHYVRSIMLSRKYSLINQLNPEKKLLDVGSGTGYFANFMKQKGYQVTGIEMDDSARRFSKERFNLEIFPPSHLLADESVQVYGVITLWHVLEHLYNPQNYWAKFQSLLKSDGFLVIAVPNHDSFDAAYYGDYWAAYDVPRHLWHFNPASIEKMAAQFGFKLLKMESMPFDPFYNSILSEKYKKSTFGFLRAACIGFVAYIQGMMQLKRASSIIYIFKKEQA